MVSNFNMKMIKYNIYLTKNINKNTNIILNINCYMIIPLKKND